MEVLCPFFRQRVRNMILTGRNAKRVLPHFSKYPPTMAVQINLGAVVQDAGKAVEDYRSPRRSAFQGGFQTAQRLGVLQPSGAYSPADVAGESLGANVKLKCYITIL